VRTLQVFARVRYDWNKLYIQVCKHRILNTRCSTPRFGLRNNTVTLCFCDNTSYYLPHMSRHPTSHSSSSSHHALNYLRDASATLLLSNEPSTGKSRVCITIQLRVPTSNCRMVTSNLSTIADTSIAPPELSFRLGKRYLASTCMEFVSQLFRALALASTYCRYHSKLSTPAAMDYFLLCSRPLLRDGTVKIEMLRHTRFTVRKTEITYQRRLLIKDYSYHE
jgi:hypothetical protein